MVTWSDFLASAPAAEFWHFLAGLAAMILVVRVFKLNWIVGLVGFAGFMAFVPFKELVLDPYYEGASVTSGIVDATWFFLGGITGTILGLLPVRAWWLPIVAAAVTLLVFAGLWTGAI